MCCTSAFVIGNKFHENKQCYQARAIEIVPARLCASSVQAAEGPKPLISLMLRPDPRDRALLGLQFPHLCVSGTATVADLLSVRAAKPANTSRLPCRGHDAADNLFLWRTFPAVDTHENTVMPHR